MLKSPPECAYSLSWAHPQLGAGSGGFDTGYGYGKEVYFPSAVASQAEATTKPYQKKCSCTVTTTTRSFRDKWSTLSGFQIWGSFSRPTTGCSAKEELSNRFFPKSCRCRRRSVHLQEIPKLSKLKRQLLTNLSCRAHPAFCKLVVVVHMKWGTCWKFLTISKARLLWDSFDKDARLKAMGRKGRLPLSFFHVSPWNWTSVWFFATFASQCFLSCWSQRVAHFDVQLHDTSYKVHAAEQQLLEARLNFSVHGLMNWLLLLNLFAKQQDIQWRACSSFQDRVSFIEQVAATVENVTSRKRFLSFRQGQWAQWKFETLHALAVRGSWPFNKATLKLQVELL